MLDSQILIYDGDCAFCQRCVDWGVRVLPDFPQALAYASILPEQFGLSLEDVQQSIWFVDVAASLDTRQAGKSHWSGHRAAAQILLRQPTKSQFGFFWRLLGFLIILGGPVSALAYRLVAKNRHRLPGATAACELPDPSDSKAAN